jgi:hypothetical protein
MSKVWWILLLMIFALPLLAQSPATMPVTGYCTLGGSHAAVSGLNSTNYLQGIIPGCTVTAYLHGTTNLATIYADDNNTPLSNPFTAVMPNSPNSGAWIFWAATGEGYDVVGSGGVAPITYPAPITLTEVFLGGGGGGGGGSCGTGTSPFLMIWDSTNTCGNSTEQDLNSTFQSSATQGAVFAQGVFDNSSVGPQVLDFGVGNDPSVGTARYYLAKVVNNVAYAATTSDTAITLYPVADTLLSNGVAKCSFGTVGAACLQVMQGGRAILTADASGIAANHYFGESTVTGAAIMDLGATPNTAGCLGIADAGAISGGATGTVRMGSCGVVGVGTSIQMKNGGTNYGSPMTGAGSQNCVGCTWSGTAPNFTITATGTGITSETFPADLFSPFTCTGPTCVFGKANAAPGTILRSQASSSYLPITQRGLATTYFNIAGQSRWLNLHPAQI